jgi:Tfp pilus assembly protein PilF
LYLGGSRKPKVPVEFNVPAADLGDSRLNNIGFCFASEGKISEAELWLKRSMLLDGKSTVAPYTNLGRVFLSQGRFKEALSILTQLDDLNLVTPDSTLLKSAILVNLPKIR